MPRLARFSLLALLVGIAFSACQEGRERAQRPSIQPSRSSEPSGTSSATGSPPTVGSPGRARCTLVLGFSVTRQWYEEGTFESQPGIDDASWELIYEGGGDVFIWSNPNMRAYTRPPVSACGQPPDRVVFQVAARRPEDVVAALQASIANIRATWPSVEVIELIPIVGGPGGQPCEAASQPGRTVDASAMNPAMNAVIAEVADGRDVSAGPDLQLADCSQYADGIGHMTPEGSRFIASALAEHYGT